MWPRSEISGINTRFGGGMRTSWGVVGMRGAWRHVLSTDSRVAGAKLPVPITRNAVRVGFLARRGNLSAIWTASYRAGFTNSDGTGSYGSWTGHDVTVDWADPLGLEGARVSAGVFNLTDELLTTDTANPSATDGPTAAGWGRTYLPHPQHALLRRKGAPRAPRDSGSRPGPHVVMVASHIVVPGRPPFDKLRTGSFVIPGLVPGISLKRLRRAAVWIPGTSPGMTMERDGAPSVDPRVDASLNASSFSAWSGLRGQAQSCVRPLRSRRL